MYGRAAGSESLASFHFFYPSAAGDGRTRGVATQLPPALLARSQTNNVGNVVVDRINEGEAISPCFAQQQ